jgi:hypothetical protein
MVNLNIPRQLACVLDHMRYSGIYAQAWKAQG